MYCGQIEVLETFFEFAAIYQVRHKNKHFFRLNEQRLSGECGIYVNELQVSGEISNSLRDDLQKCVIVSQLYCVHTRYVNVRWGGVGSCGGQISIFIYDNVLSHRLFL